MIRPPGRPGVAFSERSDGDMRSDLAARLELSRACLIPSEWATVTQVHGRDTVQVTRPGDAGTADAIWTATIGLPLAVLTADCLGVVLHADGAVGVAHAGWRGVDAGVVANLRSEMDVAGYRPEVATLGPGIRPCCFEVGPEVSARFEGAGGRTNWDTPSVDLVAALEDQLTGLRVWAQDGCTMHDDRWFSHREDGTRKRMATIGWIT